jgi:hypothetical protein
MSGRVVRGWRRRISVGLAKAQHPIPLCPCDPAPFGKVAAYQAVRPNTSVREKTARTAKH